VVDDPVKGRAEAQSKVVRDRTWAWLVDDFMTRFAAQSGLLMIGTRWHIDDPIGRLIDREPRLRLLTTRQSRKGTTDSAARERRCFPRSSRSTFCSSEKA
jgi:hypothetical protein